MCAAQQIIYYIISGADGGRSIVPTQHANIFHTHTAMHNIQHQCAASAGHGRARARALNVQGHCVAVVVCALVVSPCAARIRKCARLSEYVRTQDLHALMSMEVASRECVCVCMCGTGRLATTIMSRRSFCACWHRRLVVSLYSRAKSITQPIAKPTVAVQSLQPAALLRVFQKTRAGHHEMLTQNMIKYLIAQHKHQHSA